MDLTGDQMGTVAMIWGNERKVIIRRIEQRSFQSDTRYEVRLTQQFVIPQHGSQSGAMPEARTLTLPIGAYAKSRMPDMEVRGPNGDRLPIIERDTRARIISTQVTAPYQLDYFRDAADSNSEAHYLTWRVIQRAVGAIAIAPRDQALEMRDALRDHLFNMAAHPPRDQPASVTTAALRLFLNTKFQDAVYALVPTTIQFVLFTATPGTEVILSASYTERLNTRRTELLTSGRSSIDLWARLNLRMKARRSRRSQTPRATLSQTPVARSAHRRARRADWFRRARTSLRAAEHAWWWGLRGVIEGALQSLGLVAQPMSFDYPNIGRCQALYSLFELPSGLEPVRFFLAKNWNLPRNPDAGEVGHDGGWLVAHPADVLDFQDTTKTSSTLEVQIEPSGAVISALGVSSLLFLVSTYIYRHAIQITSGDLGNQVVALAAVFSGLPAILTGAVAIQGNYLSRKLSRLPRLLLGALAGLASVLAAAVALRINGRYVLTALSFATVVYAFALTGMLAHIQFGPRWRQNDRGRLKVLTDRRRPGTCRRLQIACALIFVAVWSFATYAMSHIQRALRFDPVLTTAVFDHAWNSFKNMF